MKYLEVSLADTKYFNVFIGKRVLKEEVFQSTGQIPLYSANVFEPFGYVSDSNIDLFDQHSILWGIDGKFEFNLINPNNKFATTDHCGVIQILDKRIEPNYLLYRLRLKSKVMLFDRGLRASLTNMSKLLIDIPVDDQGVFSLQGQSSVAERYNLLSRKTADFFDIVDNLMNSHVLIDEEGKTKTYRVDELFDFQPTNSGITKSFCQANPGEVPVYASAKSENSVLGRIKDNIAGIHYNADCLTWNRNGSVGKFFVRKGRFTTNEDHRVLKLKKKYYGEVSLEYVKYALQNKIKIIGYDFTNKLGSRKLSGVTIDLPVLDNGKPDLNRQISIAKKYETVITTLKTIETETHDLKVKIVDLINE